MREVAFEHLWQVDFRSEVRVWLVSETPAFSSRESVVETKTVPKSFARIPKFLKTRRRLQFLFFVTKR